MVKRNSVTSIHEIKNLEKIVAKLAALLDLPEKSDDCILWTGKGSKNKNTELSDVQAQRGYGNLHIRVGVDNRRTSAGVHRLAYMLFLGDIGNGMQVHHRCSNKNCLNPAHLTTLDPKVHNITHDDERGWVKEALTKDNPNASAMADGIKGVVKQSVLKTYSFEQIMAVNSDDKRRKLLLDLTDEPVWQDFVNFIYEPRFERTAAE